MCVSAATGRNRQQPRPLRLPHFLLFLSVSLEKDENGEQEENEDGREESNIKSHGRKFASVKDLPSDSLCLWILSSIYFQKNGKRTLVPLALSQIFS